VRNPLAQVVLGAPHCMLLVFRAVLGRLKEAWQKPAECKVGFTWQNADYTSINPYKQPYKQHLNL